MKKINVVGTSGSGKTTLGRALAERLGLPFVELDALNFGPNWSEVRRDIFRQRVREIVETPGWVLDGNYARVRDEVWAEADTIVWLDLPLWLSLWRVTHRTLRRVAVGEELWHGNRETVRNALLSRDSLIVWVLTTHRDRRRRYAARLAELERQGKTVVRLRTQREAREWLGKVKEGHCHPERSRGI